MVSVVTGCVLVLLTVDKKRLTRVPVANPAAEIFIIVPGGPTTGERPSVGWLKAGACVGKVGVGVDCAAPRLHARAGIIRINRAIKRFMVYLIL